METSGARAVDRLANAGKTVSIRDARTLVVDGREFDLKFRDRPTPADLRREVERTRRRSPDSALAYVVPKVSPALLAAAQGIPDVMLIALDDSVIVEYGTVIRQRIAPPTPDPREQGRVAWGRFAVMRALVQHPGARRQADLARSAGISQPAVSKALRVLGQVAESARAGSREAAATLWDQFLRDYPGPQGITTNWYALNPPAQQAGEVQVEFPEVLLSGDAGADALAPWRVVGRAIVYTRHGLDLALSTFSEADVDEATLSVTIPADPTLFATAHAWNAGRPAVRTADPMIIASDVLRIGGSDADEAIEKIREQVFRPWQ